MGGQKESFLFSFLTQTIQELKGTKSREVEALLHQPETKLPDRGQQRQSKGLEQAGIPKPNLPQRPETNINVFSLHKYLLNPRIKFSTVVHQTIMLQQATDTMQWWSHEIIMELEQDTKLKTRQEKKETSRKEKESPRKLTVKSSAEAFADLNKFLEKS